MKQAMKQHNVVGTSIAPCRIIVELDNHVMSLSLNDVAVAAETPCPSFHAVCCNVTTYHLERFPRGV